MGADNLLVGNRGRDVRAWVALFFGLVHGFGFASVLRDTGLPPRALGLSLFSFNLGVEIGQAVIVVVAAVGLGLFAAASPALAGRVATAGSVLVLLAGAFWFVERVGASCTDQRRPCDGRSKSGAETQGKWDPMGAGQPAPVSCLRSGELIDVVCSGC